MEYIKLLLNYTLAFYMWLVIARAFISLFTENPENFILNIFFKVTNPIYRLFNFLPCCKTFAIIIIILIMRYLIVIYL